jgi:hypothetical protein
MTVRRDMSVSVFGEILETFASGQQGIIAAIVVDEEGEAVDYTGTLAPYDVRILGAEAQLLMRGQRKGVRQLTLTGTKRHITVLALFEGYLLVIASIAHSDEVLCALALEAVTYDLTSEAGYPCAPAWRRLNVTLSTGGLPTAVSGEPVTVEDVRHWKEGRYILAMVRTPGGVRYEVARPVRDSARVYVRTKP